MELPDDVLQLIREYTKPWFKYHKRYKDTLIMMELESCPKLRRCLQYNPDILPTLVRFEKAYAEYLVALDNYTGDQNDHWEFYMWEFFRKRGEFFEIQSEVYRLIQ